MSFTYMFLEKLIALFQKSQAFFRHVCFKNEIKLAHKKAILLAVCFTPSPFFFWGITLPGIHVSILPKFSCFYFLGKKHHS